MLGKLLARLTVAGHVAQRIIGEAERRAHDVRIRFDQLRE
jgi:hypothetical protein